MRIKLKILSEKQRVCQFKGIGEVIYVYNTAVDDLHWRASFIELDKLEKKARILCFDDRNHFSDFKFVRDDAFSQR